MQRSRHPRRDELWAALDQSGRAGSPSVRIVTLVSCRAEMLDDLDRSQGSVINSNLVDLALEGGLLVVSAVEKDGCEPGSLARRDIAGDLGSIVSIKMNDDVPAVAGENDVVPGAGTDRRLSREDFFPEALRHKQTPRRQQTRRSVQAEMPEPRSVGPRPSGPRARSGRDRRDRTEISHRGSHDPDACWLERFDCRKGRRASGPGGGSSGGNRCACHRRSLPSQAARERDWQPLARLPRQFDRARVQHRPGRPGIPGPPWPPEPNVYELPRSACGRWQSRSFHGPSPWHGRATPGASCSYRQ